MADPTQQIIQLRQLRDTAQRHRADADAALKLGAQQLKDTEAKIRELGAKPETIDQELEALEADLQKKIEEHTAEVQAEIAAYQRILDAASAAGLR